jgi:hypothetical protein
LARRRAPGRGPFFLALLVALRLALLDADPARACTGGEIIPDQFYNNCRRLVEGVQEVAVARRVGHPDAELLTGRLVKTWIDFYLEHGEAPPPFHADIATGTWRLAMREVGLSIRRLIDQAPGHDDGEPAVLPLYLLVQPEARQTVHAWLDAWTASPPAELITGPTVASCTAWLEASVIRPVLGLRGFLAAEFPNSAERLLDHLEAIRQRWRPVRQAAPPEQEALLQTTWPSLLALIGTERTAWRTRLLLEP